MLRLRGAGQDDGPVERRAQGIVAHDVARRDHLRRRRDGVGVELLELVDVLQQVRELVAVALDLIIGQR